MGRAGTGIGSLRRPGDTAKIASLHDIGRNEFESEDSEQPLQGIEVTIHHALLERNDRVLGDRNRLGTNLPTTSRDVAVTDIVAVSQIADAVLRIERMHFECSRIDE